MGKKDYQLIAETIRELGATNLLDSWSHRTVILAFAEVLEKNHLKGGYSFDRDKFVKACQ